MSNGLDPDQARHSIGPVLGQKCLHRLSADDKRKWLLAWGELNSTLAMGHFISSTLKFCFSFLTDTLSINYPQHEKTQMTIRFLKDRIYISTWNV